MNDAIVYDYKNRRYPTVGQKAMTLVEIYLDHLEQGCQRRLANLRNFNGTANSPQGRSREVVAKEYGVSADSIKVAKKVFDKGVKELIDAVRKGEISLNTARWAVELDPADILVHLENGTLCQIATTIMNKKKGTMTRVFTESLIETS